MKRLASFGALLIAIAIFAITQQVIARDSLVDTVTITMSDFAFTPPDVTVQAGSSVVWNNSGTKKHTATADDSSFDTGVVAPGASSQPLTFDKPGKYLYFCQFHGAAGGVDMAGTITVVAAAAGTQATEVPAAAAPAAASQSPVGSAVFANKAKGANADAVKITLAGLPLPDEGKQYEAWLASQTSWLSLGKVNIKADGSATVEYADPKGQNLINIYNQVLISSQDNALTPAGPIVYSGAIPPQSDVHVKHVMAEFPDTPDKIGLLIGATEQEAVLTQHVQFMNDAVKGNNLKLAKVHLEHIHNIMTGTDGAKDLDGDGKLTISPPGDGFGIFNYLVTASQHADLAAKQPDATDNIKVKASHVKITVGNASASLTQIQALLVQAAAVKTIAELKPLAEQITKLNDGVTKGVPDASGGVSPTKGSGGLATAYTEGLAMATISILPGDITGGKGEPGKAPPPTTEAQATTAPAAAAANVVTVTMKDFEFSEQTVTIPVGGSVVFQNAGTKKHTATADDSSFDTGVVVAGSSGQPLKFDKPGTFAYFCQFHGGPGGTAMSGVIIVK